jgi:hypothetical protein
MKAISYLQFLYLFSFYLRNNLFFFIMIIKICKVDLVNGEGCVYYAIVFDKTVISREKATI